MRLPLLVLAVIALAAAGYLGRLSGEKTFQKCSIASVKDFQKNWSLTVGGLDTEAPEGTRLLFHHTGDLYERVDGHWLLLQAPTMPTPQSEYDSLALLKEQMQSLEGERLHIVKPGHWSQVKLSEGSVLTLSYRNGILTEAINGQWQPFEYYRPWHYDK